MSIQLTNRVKELEDNLVRLKTIIIEQSARISQLEYLTRAVEEVPPIAPKTKGKK